MKLGSRFLVLCGVGCLLFAGAAFGGGQPEGTKGAVKLTLWSNQADSNALKEMYRQFEAKTGNKLDIIWVPEDGFENATLSRWATGERPDIISFHGNYAMVLALNPVDNLRDLSDEEFVKRTLGGILERNASLDGVVYGVVLTYPAVFGIFYNKDIFNDLGLNIPANRDAVLQLCYKIKTAEPSIAPMFEAGGSFWPPLVMWASYMADALVGGWQDQLNARNVRISDSNSPWLHSMRSYKQFLDEGCFNQDIITAEYEDSYAALVEDRAAMVSQHTEMVRDTAEAFGKDVVNAKMGFFGFSEKTQRVTVQTVPHGTFYLPKTGNSAYEAAALEFIRFMTGPAYSDYIKSSGQLPTLEGVPVPDKVDEPLRQAMNVLKKYGSAPPIWDSLPGLADLGNWPSELIAGQKAPEQLAEEIQIAADQGARTAGLPGWD